MKPNDADVFFTGTLLGFDEPSCAIQADDQATSDLRIQSSAVSSLFDPKHALDPGHHLMRAWIARFVEIDHTGADVGFKVALEWSTSHRNWGEMSSSDE